MTTRNEKAPAKAGAKMTDRVRIAYTFDDGEVVHLDPADVLVRQILQWAKMTEFDDPEIREVARARLYEVAQAATEKGLTPFVSAAARWARDPRTAGMNAIRKEWERWQRNEVIYRSDADFGRKMHLKHPEFTSDRSIAQRAAKWRKQARNTSS